MTALADAWMSYTLTMLWQSSLLMAVVWAAYLLLWKQSAALRYGLLCLILLKLMLPTSLHSVTGVGHWLGEFAKAPPSMVRSQPPATPSLPPLEMDDLPSMTSPSSVSPEPAPLSPQPPPRTTYELNTILFALWLAGVILLSLLLVGHAMRLRGRFQKAEAVADPSALELLDRCRAEMGMSRKIPLYTLKKLPSPILAGLLRPRILISKTTLEALDETHLRPILLHELAHAKRYDLWVNTLQILLQVVWFFHPGLWFTNWLIRREREKACDDLVLERMQGTGTDYAESILRILKESSTSPWSTVGLLGIAERGGALQGRIRRILDTNRRLKVRVGLLGGMALILLGAVLLPMAKGESPSDALVSEVDLTDPHAIWEKVVEVNHSWLFPNPENLSYTLHMLGADDPPEAEIINRVYVNGDRLRWEMEGKRFHKERDPDQLDYAMVQDGDHQFFYRPEQYNQKGLLRAEPNDRRFKQGFTWESVMHALAAKGLPPNTTVRMGERDGKRKTAILECILEGERINIRLGLRNLFYGSNSSLIASVRIHIKLSDFVPIVEEAISPDGDSVVTHIQPEYFYANGHLTPRKISITMGPLSPLSRVWVREIEFQEVDDVWLLKEGLNLMDGAVTGRIWVTDVGTEEPDPKLFEIPQEVLDRGIAPPTEEERRQAEKLRRLENEIQENLSKKQTSLLDSIPPETLEVFDPEYVGRFPQIEKKVPSEEEVQLLETILNCHRSLDRVQVKSRNFAYDFAVRVAESEELADLRVRAGTHFRLNYSPDWGYPEGSIFLGRSSSNIPSDGGEFIRDKEKWWADVSEYMRCKATLGYNGESVWFRYDEKVLTRSKLDVDRYEIAIARPIGDDPARNLLEGRLVYLGARDFRGACDVFTQRKTPENCPGAKNETLERYYFDSITHFLKKRESVTDLSLSPEEKVLWFAATLYSIEPLAGPIQEQLFALPDSPNLTIEPIAPSLESELTVTLSDGMQGSVAANYRVRGATGSWGSGLN